MNCNKERMIEIISEMDTDRFQVEFQATPPPDLFDIPFSRTTPEGFVLEPHPTLREQEASEIVFKVTVVVPGKVVLR